MSADVLAAIMNNFIIASESEPYLSMRVWKVNGSIRFFLTNNDRNSRHPNTFSTPATATPTSTKFPRNQTSSKSTSPVPFPAKIPQESVIENAQDDSGVSDLAFPTVPCQNRFEMLSVDQDQHDQPQPSNDQESAVSPSLSTSPDKTTEQQEEDTNREIEAEENRSVADDSALNRLCVVCEEIRVPNPWNLQCRACWMSDPI